MGINVEDPAVIKSAITQLGTTVKDAGSTVVDQLKQAGTGIVDKISTVFDDKIKSIGGLEAKTFEDATQLITTASNELNGFQLEVDVHVSIKLSKPKPV